MDSADRRKPPDPPSHVQVETSFLDAPRCCTHACPTLCVDCRHTSSPHTVSDRTVVYLPTYRLAMCLILSEVCVQSGPVWLSGCLERPFQPLLNVGIRQYRANAMPARLAAQSPGRSSDPHHQSTGQLRLSPLSARAQMHLSFFFLARLPFISSWQGLGWRQSDRQCRRSALRY